MKRLLLLAILSIFNSYCDLPTKEEDLSVTIFNKSELLIIKNKRNETLYLFLVEQGYAASINWAPHFNIPKVNPYESILFPFTEIVNGDTNSSKTGDDVIVNYWTGINKTKPSIKSIVIRLK